MSLVCKENLLQYTNDKSLAIFDIESDNINIDKVCSVHCLVIKDYKTGIVKSYYDLQIFTHDTFSGGIKEGLSELEKYDIISGHNIISYDLQVLKRLYNFEYKGLALDTLTLSRTLVINIAQRDSIAINAGRINKDSFVVWNSDKGKEESAIGRHSLESWGLRLKFQKDKFGRYSDWKNFSQEMLIYCIQDVNVNTEMLRVLMRMYYPVDAILLELKVQHIIDKQIRNGWEFDTVKASELYSDLVTKRANLESRLYSEFPGWYHEMKTPEFYTFSYEGETWKSQSKGDLCDYVYNDLKARGTKVTKKYIKDNIKDGPIKQKHEAFNPGSRIHVHKILSEKYGWKPSLWNEDGTPQINEQVLAELEYPEAKLLLEWEVLKDRLEKLAEGKKGGYLMFQKNGRIYGYCNPLGADTYRATHSTPNLAQVPSLASEYGAEFRSLFKARKGYKLVGTDADSQELRCLAHFMAKFDNGAYAKVVAEGKKEDKTDIHNVNARSLGIDSRDKAKVFIYAWLYGAGNAKIAAILGVPVSRGGEFKRRFLDNTPGLEDLQDYLKHQYQQLGFITALDGRPLYVKSDYKCLNYLLQSTGAILTKRWMVIIDDLATKAGLDYKQCAWIHDELQYEVREDQAEEFSNICKIAMKEVEKYYDFKCPLDCGVSIGDNWKETH